MPNQHIVFVYGTLKRGHDNHRFLETARFIGEAETVERMFMFQSGAPVVTPRDPDGKHPEHPIRGEVYAVDDATLARLDRLEGAYDRKVIAVNLKGGTLGATAFIYMMDEPFYTAEASPVIDGRYVFTRRKEDF